MRLSSGRRLFLPLGVEVDTYPLLFDLSVVAHSVCHNCPETRAVDTCQVCGAFVCPAHRWSTGDPEDGYYCVDSFCIPKQKTPFSMPPWASDIVDEELERSARIPPTPRPVPARPANLPARRGFSPGRGFIVLAAAFVAAVVSLYELGWI